MDNLNKLLLEIGIEDFPKELFGLVKRSLEEEFEKLFHKNKIPYEKIKIESTKKRVVIIVSGLINDLEESENLYNFFKINIPEVIRKITIPVYHKKDTDNTNFVDYIIWIQCVIGNRLIHFDSVDDISDNKGLLRREYLQIEPITAYLEKLEKNSILLDIKKRKDLLNVKASKLAREHGYQLYKPQRVIDKLNNYYDYPACDILQFDAKHLILDDAILHTILYEEFDMFSIVDDNKNAVNYVIYGHELKEEIDVESLIQKLNNRFGEIQLLLGEDLLKPLEYYKSKLYEMPYLSIGTYEDKTFRLSELATHLGDHLDVGEETIFNIQKVAALSKIDLSTNVVKQVPSLRGTVGMIYGKRINERDIVATGIQEHYKPLFSDEELPKHTSSKIVSISDKMDELIVMYVQEECIKSLDGLKLRRNALGIIDVILGSKWFIGIDEIIKDALFTLLKNTNMSFDNKRIAKLVQNIIKINFRDTLIRKGFRFYVIDGIMDKFNGDLYNTYICVKDLSEINDETNNKLLYFLRDLNNLQLNMENVLPLSEEQESLLLNLESSIEKRDYKGFFSKINKIRTENDIMGEEFTVTEDKVYFYKSLNALINSILEIDSVIFLD